MGGACREYKPARTAGAPESSPPVARAGFAEPPAAAPPDRLNVWTARV